MGVGRRRVVALRPEEREELRAQEEGGGSGSADFETRLVTQSEECEDNPKGWHEWPTARKEAWKKRKSSPNVYYYRFKDPNEEVRKGSWTPPEHEMFLNLLHFWASEEIAWGLFAQRMPGRVGYQCRSYYNQLVAKGIVKPVKIVADAKKAEVKTAASNQSTLQQLVRTDELTSSDERTASRHKMARAMSLIGEEGAQERATSTSRTKNGRRESPSNAAESAIDKILEGEVTTEDESAVESIDMTPSEGSLEKRKADHVGKSAVRRRERLEQRPRLRSTMLSAHRGKVAKLSQRALSFASPNARRSSTTEEEERESVHGVLSVMSRGSAQAASSVLAKSPDVAVHLSRTASTVSDLDSNGLSQDSVPMPLDADVDAPRRGHDTSQRLRNHLNSSAAAAEEASRSRDGIAKRPPPARLPDEPVESEQIGMSSATGKDMDITWTTKNEIGIEESSEKVNNISSTSVEDSVKASPNGNEVDDASTGAKAEEIAGKKAKTVDLERTNLIDIDLSSTSTKDIDLSSMGTERIDIPNTEARDIASTRADMAEESSERRERSTRLRRSSRKRGQRNMDRGTEQCISGAVQTLSFVTENEIGSPLAGIATSKKRERSSGSIHAKNVAHKRPRTRPARSASVQKTCFSLTPTQGRLQKLTATNLPEELLALLPGTELDFRVVPEHVLSSLRWERQRLFTGFQAQAQRETRARDQEANIFTRTCSCLYLEYTGSARSSPPTTHRPSLNDRLAKLVCEYSELLDEVLQRQAMEIVGARAAQELLCL